MRADPKRKSGFYWVRFEGAVIVAEYHAGNNGPWWAVPDSSGRYWNNEVCELLSGRLEPPGLPETPKPNRQKAANKKASE